MKRKGSSTASAPLITMQSPVKHVSQYSFPVSEAPTEVWERQSASEPAGGHHRLWLWGGGLFVIGLAVLLALAGGILMLWYSDWILPGVQVFGIDLGKQTTAQAQTALTNYWNEQAITLDNGTESRTVRPETLGITFDAAATVQLAYHQGRSLGNLGRILQAGGHLSLPPVWVFDASVAKANLQALAPQLLISPVDATVHIQDGQVAVVAAQTGSELDITATLAGLVKNPAQAFVDGRLPLIMTPVEPAVRDVKALVDRANHLLSTLLAVQGYDPVTDESTSWTLTPDIWSHWMTLEIVNLETGEFEWRLEPEPLKSFLTAQLQSLGPDRRLDWGSVLPAISEAIAGQESVIHIRIYHQAGQHMVQAGETVASIGRTHGIPYPWIQQANPGVNDVLSVGQLLTIPSPDELLPLPVLENKRIVVSISQQRMWAYENGGLRWDWPASTGIDSSPTSPGIFQIQSHESNAYAASWDLWMPYFMGIYRPVPTAGFMNGFHGFPTRDGANLLWTGSLGHQVTYGCILISTENAALLYNWAEEGVIVDVKP